MDTPRARVEIYGTSQKWLKQEDWEAEGYKSLAEYVEKLTEEGGEKEKRESKNLPLCSFSCFDLKTGQKDFKLLCQTKEDLPTEDIPGVLEFKK